MPSVFAAIANMDHTSSARTGQFSATNEFGTYWRNMSSKSERKPRIGVFKFASCDGCQLSLLDAEDELLGIAGAVDIAYFPEATRAMSKGPYDIGLVEGSITTYQDAQRIQEVRRQCKNPDHNWGMCDRGWHSSFA